MFPFKRWLVNVRRLDRTGQQWKRTGTGTNVVRGLPATAALPSIGLLARHSSAHFRLVSIRYRRLFILRTTLSFWDDSSMCSLGAGDVVQMTIK